MRDKGYPISPLQGDSDATDEMGMGGVGLSDPIQHAHKKSRPKPLCWTRVAMVTSLPLGTRSAGNQLKVCECVCVCESDAWRYKKTVMSSLLLQLSLAQDGLVKRELIIFSFCPSRDFLVVSVLVSPSEDMW